MTQRKSPWKTLSRSVVYENPWISVREDRVIRPDGSEGIYGVVDTRVATGVIALDESGQIYLVGQYRYPLDRYSWEIVEGGADPGEDPLTAIKRELHEEAGLTANCWRQLGPAVHLSNCISSEVAMFYLATDLAEVGAEPDPTEVLEIRKIPAKEAIAMCMSGEITDSMSIIALMRYQALLAEMPGSAGLLSEEL